MWKFGVFFFAGRPSPPDPHLLSCGIGVCGKTCLRDKVFEWKSVFMNKYFRIGDKIYRKKCSLSIGETLGTNAANILRHTSLAPVVENCDNVRWFRGYVDDCIIEWQWTCIEFLDFQQRLACIDAQQFEFTYSDFVNSPRSVDFLDLTIEINVDLTIATSTYQKPTFVPQYLHFQSRPPHSHKNSIYKSECHRYLVNTSGAGGS